MCVLYVIYLCMCTKTDVIVLKLYTKLYLKQTERNFKLIINENEVNKVFSGNIGNQQILMVIQDVRSLFFSFRNNNKYRMRQA